MGRVSFGSGTAIGIPERDDGMGVRRHGEAWLLVLTAGGDGVVRAEPLDAVEPTLTGLRIRPA